MELFMPFFYLCLLLEKENILESWVLCLKQACLYYQKQDDPYLETREREERFVAQIVTAVENAMDKSLPVYLAGCMAGISQIAPQAVIPTPEPEDADLDWDFLGE